MNLDIVHKKNSFDAAVNHVADLRKTSSMFVAFNRVILRVVIGWFWFIGFFWCPFTMIDGSMKRNYMFGSEPQSSLDIEKRRRG